MTGHRSYSLGSGTVRTACHIATKKGHRAFLDLRPSLKGAAK